MRKLAAAAALLLALTSPTLAQTSAPVSAPPAPTFPAALAQSDLGNLRELCGLAMKSEKLTLEQTTGIGTYCQNLLARLGQALSVRPAGEAGGSPASAPPAKE
jgi:hypothetical protein